MNEVSLTYPDLDSTPVETWRAYGLPCAIMPHPDFGVLNGYVRVPSRVQELTYDDFYQRYGIMAPGGLTYGVDEHGWVGFDTLHSGDVWPIEVINKYRSRGPVEPYSLDDPCGVDRKYRSQWTVEWSEDKMRHEVNELARSLSRLRYPPVAGLVRLAALLRSHASDLKYKWIRYRRRGA